MPKIIILFSGRGSNMMNIIDNVDGIEVACVITNKKDAEGIKKVEPLGIPVHIIENSHYDSRESFDQELVNTINAYKPDLVVLAGFMRILTPVFTSAVRSINLHPSMLPLFKGAKAIEMSYEDPSKPAGVSVHFVNEELDGGEIILQKELTRIEGESFDSFKNRIHLLEYELLPAAITQLLK